MKEIQLEQLVNVTGGKLLARGSRCITAGVCTDSRSVNEDCVFFALSGDKFDGNSFASMASQKAASVVVSRVMDGYDVGARHAESAAGFSGLVAPANGRAGGRHHGIQW